MYTSNTLRDRFVDGALDTASGPKVVVMAFDRLDRDLAGAIDALESRDLARTHDLLCHAQDLVHELLFMLDPAAWEHAGSLAAIYRYVLQLLTRANIEKQAAAIREARGHLAELGEAFRQAAATPAASGYRVADPATSERAFSARA